MIEGAAPAAAKAADVWRGGKGTYLDRGDPRRRPAMPCACVGLAAWGWSSLGWGSAIQCGVTIAVRVIVDYPLMLGSY